MLRWQRLGAVDSFSKNDNSFSMTFATREEAGQKLGRFLAERSLGAELVLGLPRGGVVVAAEVARLLRLALDVLVVRKIGHPWHREFAVGALAEGGVVILMKPRLATPAPRATTFSPSSLKKRNGCASIGGSSAGPRPSSGRARPCSLLTMVWRPARPPKSPSKQCGRSWPDGSSSPRRWLRPARSSGCPAWRAKSSHCWWTRISPPWANTTPSFHKPVMPRFRHCFGKAKLRRDSSRLWLASAPKPRRSRCHVSCPSCRKSKCWFATCRRC